MHTYFMLSTKSPLPYTETSNRYELNDVIQSTTLSSFFTKA